MTRYFQWPKDYILIYRGIEVFEVIGNIDLNLAVVLIQEKQY